MKYRYFIMFFIIISFGFIGCNLIVEEEISNILFVYRDLEKYNTFLELEKVYYEQELRTCITYDELLDAYLDTYIEVHIKKEYWKELIKIINSSRIDIWRAIGIVAGRTESDYSIRIHFENDEMIHAGFWVGSNDFFMDGTRIIRRRDRNRLYELLNSIKEESIIDRKTSA